MRYFVLLFLALSVHQAHATAFTKAKWYYEEGEMTLLKNVESGVAYRGQCVGFTHPESVTPAVFHAFRYKDVVFFNPTTDSKVVQMPKSSQQTYLQNMMRNPERYIYRFGMRRGILFDENKGGGLATGYHRGRYYSYDVFNNKTSLTQELYLRSFVQNDGSLSFVLRSNCLATFCGSLVPPNFKKFGEATTYCYFDQQI